MTSHAPVRAGLFVSLILPLGALFGLFATTAGCAETVRDFGAGGAGGDPASSSTSTSTGAGGAGGVGGDGGAGGVPPVMCLPGDPPYAGPLCGSPDMPCKLLVDQPLSSPPSFRNGAPGVAADLNCEPQIVYSVAMSGFKGFLAKRGADGVFVEEPTPFEYASGGIAAGPDGVTSVLAYGGAFNATLFRRPEAGMWDVGAPVPGENTVYSRSLARDGKGTLHAGGRTKSNMAFYATFNPADSTWSSALLQPVTTGQVAVAVTPDGAPHLAYWIGMNGVWSLHWHSPPLAPELAVPLNEGSFDLGSQMHSIAVSPLEGNPLGMPQLLVLRNIPMNQSKQLTHAARLSGKWSVTTIEQEKLSGVKRCDDDPILPGQTCDFDYEEITPIGIVASQGGDSLAVYNKVNRLGTLIANCDNPMLCYWMTQVDNSVGQIVLAKFDEGVLVAQGSVNANVIIQGGTAALDTIGRVHIAVYARSPGKTDTIVRYFLVGP